MSKEERKPAISRNQIKMIQEIAENVLYGTITLVFQNGILVQIDRKEKMRIPGEPNATNQEHSIHEKGE